MQRANWYLQRLRAMSPLELPWRAWRMGRARLGQWSHWPAAKDVPIQAVCAGPCTAESLRQIKSTFPHCPDRAELGHWPGPWREACLAEAEDVLAHRFSFFMFDRELFGKDIDWHRDYSSDKRAPLAYAGRLDYRNPERAGDVKVIWELSRMQHLPRLAQAWRYSGDERFAREITTQIADWIQSNPFMMGINWTSPMESSLRLISWTWAFHWIRDWDGLTDEFCRLLTASVHQHLSFIHKNYSLFSSANNHLIAEAGGAYLAASCWPDLKGATRFQKRARKHLLRECLRQNWPDGVNKEQTFGYSFFVWELLLLPALMGRACCDEFPAAYWQRLEHMAEFLAWVSDSKGNTPNVGDEDGGLVLKLSGTREGPAISLMHMAARIWKREDFRQWAGGPPDEKTAWLLGGAAPAAAEKNAAASPPRGSRSFTEGGYHVLRHGDVAENEALLLFDAGPLGMPPTAVHGHADALSVLLHLGGEPVFIDSGTYSYQDTPWRRYFRSTARHNTLSFGNENQGQYLNRFMWGKQPNVQLLQSEMSAAGYTLEGLVTWWTGSTHRRKISWAPQAGRLCIDDSWDGPESPVIRFHLSPSVQAAVNDEGCRITGLRMQLQMKTTAARIALEAFEISLTCYHRTAGQRICIMPQGSAGQCRTEIEWGFEV